MRRVPIILVVAGLAVAGCSSSGSKTDPPTAPQPSTGATSTTSASQTVGPTPPVNSSRLLGGTARPTFGAGQPGKVDVVYVGPIDRSESGDTVIPIALRNNTSAPVSHIDVAAALSVNGKIAVTGKSQGVQPAQLAPGEVGLAYLYFEVGTHVPAHPTYAFTTKTVPADTESYNTATAKVTQANASGGHVAGSATNTTGKTLQGPYKVNVFCFDRSNKLVSVGGEFADQDGTVEPSGTLTFTADLLGAACPSYLVGVTGYYA